MENKLLDQAKLICFFTANFAMMINEQTCFSCKHFCWHPLPNTPPCFGHICFFCSRFYWSKENSIGFVDGVFFSLVRTLQLSFIETFLKVFIIIPIKALCFGHPALQNQLCPHAFGWHYFKFSILLLLEF